MEELLIITDKDGSRGKEEKTRVVVQMYKEMIYRKKRCGRVSVCKQKQRNVL